MFKLIAVTLAAFIYVLHVFGDDARRVEVARQITDEAVGVTLASMEIVTDTSGVSESEAIRLAMAAGVKARENRKVRALNGMVAAVEATDPVVQETEVAIMRYVTGTKVNLRAGPGTGNAVVGQLGLGDETVVLADQDGWVQIETADGTISGWIYGTFLAENRPG